MESVTVFATQLSATMTTVTVQLDVLRTVQLHGWVMESAMTYATLKDAIMTAETALPIALQAVRLHG